MSRVKRKGAPNEDKPEESEPALKLRNYRPIDDGIHRAEVDPAEVIPVDDKVEVLERDAHADGESCDFSTCLTLHL